MVHITVSAVDYKIIARMNMSRELGLLEAMHLVYEMDLSLPFTFCSDE